MMKWRKRGETRPPDRNDETEYRSGVFRSLSDLPVPVASSTRRDEQTPAAALDQDAGGSVIGVASKVVSRPRRRPDEDGAYETVPIVVNRKISAPGGQVPQRHGNAQAGDGQSASVFATFKGEGAEAQEVVAMPGSYGSIRGDRDLSIYESTPAFRLEPLVTDAAGDVINKTTIAINTPAADVNPTTLVITSAGATTLVINHSDNETRVASPTSSASVSPLSRGSSHRTTDTDGHSSGTGSTFYLTGGVGSPLTPLGSTTRLITQGSQRNSFKVDTGWLPAWGTVFTVLSLVVGLGNIVRLPRVVYLHGDGPFLVVYMVITLVLGIPLVFLEIGLGQFCEEGVTKLWRAVPLFKGVGYVKMLISALLSIYYPILMTISLFYMIWSAKGLPFSECVHSFIGEVAYNHTTSGEDCLHHTFLRPPKDDGMWFGVNVALMFLIWAIIMLCLFKNRQSFRIAAYLVVVPVILILVALLVENTVRDPDAPGLKILFTFDWNVLLDIEVWYFATIQMFFSLHLGFGNIITSAGRLYPQSNAFWTATMFVLCNLSLGIISVIITYYYVGQLEIDRTSLIKMPEVFIFTLFYDAATTVIKADNQLWAAFGYLAFVLSGLAAMLTLVFTILEAMTMELSKKIKWEWWQKTGVVCAAGFLIGVPSLLPYELELVHILDHYVIGRMVIASTILELIGIGWIYGCGTLYIDFEFILGYRLNPIWKYIWWIAPVLLLVVEIWSLVSLPLTGLYQEHDDELWVFATGWTLYLISWVIIIATAIYQISKQIDYNMSSRILSTLKPSRKWGPVDTMYRHNWHKWRNQTTVPGERDYTLKRRGTKDYTHTLKRARSPQNLHFQTTLSPANTLRSNRGLDKLPYTINDTQGHVCWRGNQNQNGITDNHSQNSVTDINPMHITHIGDQT